MSDQTIEAPPINAVTRPESAAPRRRPPLGAVARQHPWALAGVALVLFSAALVLWARTRPGYDPYGWLVIPACAVWVFLEVSLLWRRWTRKLPTPNLKVSLAEAA